MNIERNLILVKGQDKTEEIEYCNPMNRTFRVKFFHNNKIYTYRQDNLIFLTLDKQIDANTSIVYNDNKPISGVHRILDFGLYIKLIFQRGFAKIYRSSEIKIEQTALLNKNVHNCFDYLKTLANVVSDKKEEGVSLLKRQYDEMKFISPKSVLANFLGKKPLASIKREAQPIFPFGFNVSQKIATERAMVNNISIIEGPPGTGKTQTILNIIANAVLNNKTVAVVSNNNSATANVKEKLEKYGLDFILATLGNKQNKEGFFHNQTSKYPDMTGWTVNNETFQSIKHNLQASQKKLNEMLAYQNKQAICKQQLSDIQTEYKYFEAYCREKNMEQISVKSFTKLKTDKLLQVLIEYEKQAERGRIKLSYKLYNLFFLGIYELSIYNYPAEYVISYLQQLYYKKKISELTNVIKEIDLRLKNFHFKREMDSFSEKSMQLFKAILARKYGGNELRKTFNQSVLRKDFDSFNHEYPVILSTTHSLRQCISEHYLFDYVLIDEASQVDIVTGGLAMSCAKKLVVVGDVKQLPNVVPDEIKEQTNELFNRYQIDRSYHYADHSLLSSIASLFTDVPKTLLKEHYRCHPKIIGFCNKKFYNNELIVFTDDQGEDDSLVLFKTVSGNHARGTINQRQIDVITKEIIPEHTSIEEDSIGIIAPFRLQADALQKEAEVLEIEADTVHKYQGREKDVIILSTVANRLQAADFADNANLINVAVSRAVKKLIIVAADGSEDWHGTNIGDLIRYIKYNNFEIIESNIHSVFDLLYSQYAAKRIQLLKRSKRVSAYDSENLMNGIITKVLNKEGYHSLDYVLHQPLRMLIKDTSKLTEAERKYANNILTHTDFIIFNKMDKMPVLVVEVDGHAFHANNLEQLKRDKMKDSILNKYGIPIIRMKTTGSEEEQVLANKLKELY